MTQEREETTGEKDAEGAGAPFDDDPPVDPGEPQVGNSKAKFFLPHDEETGEAEEGQGEGESNE